MELSREREERTKTLTLELEGGATVLTVGFLSTRKGVLLLLDSCLPVVGCPHVHSSNRALKMGRGEVM